MEKVIIVMFLVFVFISGCSQTEEPICKTPYFEYKTDDCCLDQNDNSICDEDESVEIIEGPKIDVKEESREPDSFCGDGNCDEDESKSDCSKDCGEPYSVSDLKSTINTVYQKDGPFKEGSLKVNKDYEGTTLDYVKLYDSTYATIIEIEDEERFIETDEDFKQFVDEYEKAQIVDDEIELDEQDRPMYEYDMEISSKFVEMTDDKLIDYRYWAKVYEIHYGDETSGKRLTTPIGKAYVYLKCTPNLIVVVYPNDYVGLASMWGGLTDEEYENLLESSIQTDFKASIEEAKLILEECS